MRLLHLASEYPPEKVYGLGRFVHGLARAQAAQGDEVLVLTNSVGGDEDDEVVDGVHLHRIEFPNPPRPADGQGEVLQWNHGVVSRLLDRIPAFQKVDLVLGHDWLTALAAREVAALLGKPLVVTFHDEVTGKHLGLLPDEQELVLRLEALTAHDANHVIANSRYVARQVVRLYGLPPERVTTIPGGIDPALHDLDHPEEVAAFRGALAEPEEPLVLYAGRLDPEKGLGVLAEAWPQVLAACPAARLALAGSGRLEGPLAARLPRARLLGYAGREALPYLYRAADVVAIPSLYEPFGLVALEAALAARATVASDAGGLAEIVRHERTGLTVPAGDPAALAAALVRSIQDPALRARLGDSARVAALEEHAWSVIARRTREVYERVLGQPPALCREAPKLARPAIAAVRPGEEAPAEAEYVLVRREPTQAPPGCEHWLEALVWLLEERGARSVSPTLVAPGGMGGPLAEPRRVTGPESACALVRRADATALAAGRALPGEHWQHPVTVERAWRQDELPASVVVVAYKNLHLTRAALEALLAHTAPPFELVLVDNGSRDGTRELFQDLAARGGLRLPVQVLVNEQNLGYPQAANQAIAAARGRHVVLLNNDALVRPGWLTALLAAAGSRSRVGAVTAKVLNLDGTVQSAGGILHALDGRFEVPFQGEDRLAPSLAARREVENAGGPCLLLTRQLLDRLADTPPLDPVYSPAYFEDSDLSLRAREAGFVLLYEPGAEVVHHGKATAELVAREGSLDVWGQFERNQSRFLTRWRGRLEEDERARAAQRRESPPRRVLLCYHRSETTTAFYCERALRRRHHLVSAGQGQELDLGPDASVAELVQAAEPRLGGPPDLLLVVEGANYIPPGLEAAPCRTAWWAIDGHLHAVGPRPWHLGLASTFDRVFVAQRDLVEAYAERGARADWLPLACDPELHAPAAVPRDLEVVFVGHALPIHERRRALMERLGRRFALVEVQGAFGPDMTRLLSRARVVFNASLLGDLNMRVFEALSAGALLVTDRVANGQEELFGDGEHLLLYQDECLEEVVAAALALPEEVRGRITTRARRLVTRHHSYQARMERLLEAALADPVPNRLAGALAEVAR